MAAGQRSPEDLELALLTPVQAGSSSRVRITISAPPGAPRAATSVRQRNWSG